METKCLVINGDVGDSLDYKSKAQTGLSVIAIGGDKLSRGLTLEGLTISYFTRSTSLYDTLMQMGRWFGYRTGFEDLCRIYTTPELYDWYRHITTAFESLRAEFIEMARLKLTPKDFGLRVEDHPDMMVTNVMKMRDAEPMKLNYQGTLTQTTTFPSDENILKSNLEATAEFIKSISKPNPKFKDKNVWTNIDSSKIQTFLKSYETFQGLPSANTRRIDKYINTQVEKDIPEFTKWNVSLISLPKKNNELFVPLSGFDIYPINRSLKDNRTDRLFVKGIVNPPDEFVDFSEEELKIIKNKSAKEAKDYGPRKHNPLLIIYIIKIIKFKSEAEEELTLKYHVVGFAISWPKSSTAIGITYQINSVYIELEMTEND